MSRAGGGGGGGSGGPLLRLDFRFDMDAGGGESEDGNDKQGRGHAQNLYIDTHQAAGLPNAESLYRDSDTPGQTATDVDASWPEES